MNPRIERLKNILERKGIDAIILLHPANISYLAGTLIEDSSLFINKGNCLLITDSRYFMEYQNLLKNKEIQIIETNKPLIYTLKKINKKFKVKKLAFEEKQVSFSFYQKLKSVFTKKLIPAKETTESLRLIKDDGELRLIKKAVSITLDTFKHIKVILRPGMRETELAAEIERFIRLKGATRTAFDLIVASGPNSSFPHARITNRIIRNNEPVLIDMGVEYQGYKSDLTRVFFLGKMDTLFRRVYDTVKTAQQKAIRLIRPAMPIAYIDREARNFIARAGFKNNFRHSLGHGLGLEVHELPKINSKNKKKLEKGMVFTVEPGIYLNNKFGVRIEDMILVTPKGAEVLSVS